MLTLENTTITLGAFTLRADVRFSKPITALIGPSGAGKSTVLNIIAGFVPLSGGRILWQDETISETSPAKRPVAMLFQDNNLFPHLDVLNNLSLALTTKRPSAAQVKHIGAALERVGLAGFENRKPATLSGGQQSRVALARVLLQARPLMLLDEPFAALGPALKNEMLDLVASVSAEENMQIIMVTHDPRDAMRIADEATIVANGTLSAPRETKALLQNPPPELINYLGK